MAAEFSTFVNEIRATKFATLLIGGKFVINKEMDKAVRKAAVFLAAKTRTGIRKQSPGGKPFTPLKDATKKAKGSSKALIDLGDLMRSIKAQKVSTATYVVGVHRTARNKSGTKLVLIGKIHEEGYPKNLSQAVKQVEAALSGKGNNVSIPARPYLEPTFLKHKDKIVEMVGMETGVKFFGGF